MPELRRTPQKAKRKKTKLGPMSPRPTGRPKTAFVPGGPPGTRPKTGPRAKPTPKFKFDIPTRDKFKKMANGGDLAKMMKTSGRINTDDLARAQGMLGNMLKAVKKNPSLVGANKEIMDLAKKLKPTGRLNTDDIRRVREMLRKGKKPVLDSKGKPVKNLFQKADPVKKMTPEQKKQIERFKNVLKKIGSPPRRQIKKEGAIPLIGAARGAMKGMRKPAGKMMKTAARRMRKTI
jgi:hypothetical protein